LLSRKSSPQWVLEGDIKGAFDNVCHEWIKENIPINKEILMKFQKCGYIEAGKLFPTEQGTGQGQPISPTIFNMVLDGMEEEIRQLAREIKRRERRNPKIHICRYADDFVVTGYSKEILESEIKPLIEEFLSTRGLHLSEEKTIITHIDEGFDFLGWNVRKYKGKLLIKPAKKKTIAFLNRVRETIKRNKAIEQKKLILLLNPMLRGWAQHHKRICAKQVYQWVDFQIWKCLWQWAKRRHPDKNKAWIKDRYFHSIGNRNWVFGVKDKPKSQNPERQYTQLYTTASTKIQRHVKVKSGLNPFDADWWGYLEARKKQK
jgi:RNA-directed DNA polymerase